MPVQYDVLGLHQRTPDDEEFSAFGYARTTSLAGAVLFGRVECMDSAQLSKLQWWYQ